jgi:hypothetical protein
MENSTLSGVDCCFSCIEKIVIKECEQFFI